MVEDILPKEHVSLRQIWLRNIDRYSEASASQIRVEAQYHDGAGRENVMCAVGTLRNSLVNYKDAPIKDEVNRRIDVVKQGLKEGYRLSPDSVFKIIMGVLNKYGMLTPEMEGYTNTTLSSIPFKEIGKMMKGYESPRQKDNRLQKEHTNEKNKIYQTNQQRKLEKEKRLEDQKERELVALERLSKVKENDMMKERTKIEQSLGLEKQRLITNKLEFKAIIIQRENEKEQLRLSYENELESYNKHYAGLLEDNKDEINKDYVILRKKYDEVKDRYDELYKKHGKKNRESCNQLSREISMLAEKVNFRSRLLKQTWNLLFESDKKQFISLVDVEDRRSKPEIPEFMKPEPKTFGIRMKPGVL